MKNLKLLALLLFVSLLSACGESEPIEYHTAGEFLQTPNSSAAIKSVVSACPGLEKYHNDFSFTSFGKQEYYADGLESDPTEINQLELLVNENNLELPNAEFQYPQGHSCFFQIYDNGDIKVAKRPCISLCEGKRFEGPSSTLVQVN
jgi:hypothetical protein